MDSIEEIKSRLSIEEVVGDYVQMKKVGHNFKALCPFHNEKTPSFIISPDKQIAYCFGCHKGGDIFKFMMEIENIDFHEALEVLAKKAGVILKSEARKATRGKKDLLFELNELASQFFQKNLPGEAQNYLEKRGLTEETIKNFRIGFAPKGWDHLTKFLTGKGFKLEDLVSAGLCVWKDIRSEGVYDRFRERIMFPLINVQGQVVGFSGRILHEGEPKYLNSPETLIFQKKNFLYGLNKARSAIKEKNQAIFVEGQMDLIACHQAKIENTVATSGTALTTYHLRTIRRFTDNLILAFDADTAGIEATRRAIEIAAEHDLNCRIMSIPTGKDPADTIKENPASFIEAINKSMVWLEFFFEKIFNSLDLSQIANKKTVVKELTPIFHRLTNEIEKETLIKNLAQKLTLEERTVKTELQKRKKSYLTNHESVVLSDKNEVNIAEYLLALLINHPKNIELASSLLSKQLPVSEELAQIFHQLFTFYAEQKDTFALNDFLLKIDPASRDKIALLALKMEETWVNFSEEDLQKTVKSAIERLIRTTQKEIIRKLNKELQAAEETKDEKKRLEILAKQRDLLKW